jgi:hypothetical protein
MARACARDPTTFVPPREGARPEHTRQPKQPKQQEQLRIHMPYCIDKSLLRLRTVASLAHVIQALVQSQLQKHTSLYNLNQISKYILNLRVLSSILRK